MTMTDRMIDLVEDGFDLAVRNMAVPNSSLITRRVASYRFVVCGAPSYFAKRGTPETPADLARHNCLIISAPLGAINGVSPERMAASNRSPSRGTCTPTATTRCAWLR